MMQLEDQTCPYCKSTSFSNPLLTMMINNCGHTLCESCVNVLFYRGSGECPECNTPIRRSDYRVQMFEDTNVERELQIRKSILKLYNKKEDDFDTLTEYNDYLEEIEVIISNLANKIDVANTQKRIEEYKRLNSDNIHRNRFRLGHDEKEIDQILAFENEKDDNRRLEMEKHETECKKKRENFKTALLDELQYGNRNADLVINEFVEKANKMREDEKIIKINPKPVQPVQSDSQLPTYSRSNSLAHRVRKVPDGPLFVYKPQELPRSGPPLPTLDEIKKGGYTKHMDEPSPEAIAGGYCSGLVCQRAIQEAFLGF